MPSDGMTRVRMDKWLWAARFFKTRSIATRACELGRIEANGQQSKASREVRVGDLLIVKNDGGDFQVEVLVLSEMRGPVAVAQTLYRETEASRESRLTEVRHDRGQKAAKSFRISLGSREVCTTFAIEFEPFGEADAELLQ